MSLLSRALGLSARRQPSRVFELVTESRMPLRGWEKFKEEATAGPMAMGASGLLARADNTGLDMGLIATGGIGGIIGATQLARLDQEARDLRERSETPRAMLRALQRLRMEQQRAAGFEAARQTGYLGGLERAQQELERDVRSMNDGTYQEDRFMRNRGY